MAIGWAALLLPTLFAGAFAGRLHLVTNRRAGLLDPGTGLVQLDELVFPKLASARCKWELLRGTVGQTSTSFYTNSSIFMVAQEVCNSSSVITGTHLLSLRARGSTANVLDSGKDLTALVAAADGGAAKALSQLHVAWDFTCNIIVTASNTTTSGYPRNTTYARVEVSEYDGEVRPLPAAGNETAGGCDGGCWKRVSGPGGLSSRVDWGAWRRKDWEGERPDETNCGVECASFVVESWWNGYAESGRRRIIGRGVHNASVVSNVSEPTQLRTMSWLPPNRTQRANGWTGTFIGLGECCELEDCPPECEGHGGQLSIVAYYPPTAGGYGEPRVVLPLKGSHAASDTRAVRMGVAIDHAYPVGEGRAAQQQQHQLAPRVTVWVGGQLRSYMVTYDDFAPFTLPTITPIALTGEVVLDADEEPVMMAFTNF